MSRAERAGAPYWDAETLRKKLTAARDALRVIPFTTGATIRAEDTLDDALKALSAPAPARAETRTPEDTARFHAIAAGLFAVDELDDDAPMLDVCAAYGRAWPADLRWLLVGAYRAETRTGAKIAPIDKGKRGPVEVPTYPSGTVRYVNDGRGWLVWQAFGAAEHHFTASLVSHSSDTLWMGARLAEALDFICALLATPAAEAGAGVGDADVRNARNHADACRYALRRQLERNPDDEQQVRELERQVRDAEYALDTATSRAARTPAGRTEGARDA